MAEKSTNVTASAPLSLTDALTAVEKLAGLLERVVGWVNATDIAVKRFKGRRAATSADTLNFASGGSRKHLEAIATGRGTPADFEAISTRMRDTGDEVEKAIADIQKSRKFIRQRYGMKWANQLDNLIYGQGGKESIRHDLERLAMMSDPFYSVEDVSAEARIILQNIQTLNEGLAKSHDILVELRKQEQ